MALTIYGSLLPFNFTFLPFDDAVASFQNIAHFSTLDLGARGDWLISFAQYAIVSFLAMGAISPHRSLWIQCALGVVLAIFGILLAVSLEFLQVYFPPRTVSQNDIVVESGGFAFGVLVWIVFGRMVTAWLVRIGSVYSVSGLAHRYLPAYLIILAIVHWMPFDFVVGQQELALKYQEGKINLIPFHGMWNLDALNKQFLNIGCFALLGALWSVASNSHSKIDASLPWLAVIVVPTVELVQLLAYSRSFDITDIFTGIAGVFIGQWMATQFVLMVRSQSRRSANAVKSSYLWLMRFSWLLWLGVVFYVFWRPFDFTTDFNRFTSDPEDLPLHGFRRMSLMPFVDYYWGSKYMALDNFVRKAIAFVPLGALGAWSLFGSQYGSAFRIVLVGVFIACLLEVGRYFLPSRLPSTTDILIAGGGTWIGFKMAVQFRAVIWAESNLLPWKSDSRFAKTQCK